MNVTEHAINLVIANRHIAKCQHLVRDTTPDQPSAAAESDDEAFQRLQAAALMCGC